MLMDPDSKSGWRRWAVLEVILAAGQDGISESKLAKLSRVRHPLLAYALVGLLHQGEVELVTEEPGDRGGRRFCWRATDLEGGPQK